MEHWLTLIATLLPGVAVAGVIVIATLLEIAAALGVWIPMATARDAAGADQALDRLPELSEAGYIALARRLIFPKVINLPPSCASVLAR